MEGQGQKRGLQQSWGELGLCGPWGLSGPWVRAGEGWRGWEVWWWGARFNLLQGGSEISNFVAEVSDGGSVGLPDLFLLLGEGREKGGD